MVATGALKHFSSGMSKILCGGGNGKSNTEATLVRSYYCLIDNAFREWLAGIHPAESSREEKMAEWERKSYYYARQTVEDFVTMRNINIYAHKEEEGRTFTVPQIINAYFRELRQIYPGMTEEVGREEMPVQ